MARLPRCSKYDVDMVAGTHISFHVRLSHDLLRHTQQSNIDTSVWPTSYHSINADIQFLIVGV